MTDPTIDDVRTWLAEIPDLRALLPDAAVTRAAINGPRPAPASRPPCRLDVLDLLDTRSKGDWTTTSAASIDPDRQGVLPYLDTWVRDLEATAYDGDTVFGIAPRETPPPAAPEQPTIASLCSWLAQELDWAATLPQWPDLADGIRSVHRRLLAATHAVRDHESRQVPCPRCGAALAAVPGTTPAWQCTSCWHLVTVQAVTLRQAARILGIPKSTLHDWSRRPGILPPVAVLDDRTGGKLYDLADIRRLAAEARLRGA